MERTISICGKRWTIVGSDDDHYVNRISDPFSPNLISILALMCDEGDRVLDIGANIGCTAIALSLLTGSGSVNAFEPVPRTFSSLATNAGKLPNVTAHNFALGSRAATLPMQGDNHNSSGAFIACDYHISQPGHFTIDVPVRTLDEAFPTLGIDRVDFMKVDVEGFELDVFEGGCDTLHKFKPRVVLEMNHFCLNMFRRTTIPDFRARLLKMFPYVFAIEGTTYRDFTDEDEAYTVCHEHITQSKYFDLVAGFDRADLISRLAGLDRAGRILDEANRVSRESQERHHEVNRLQSALDDVHYRHQAEIAEKSARIAELERDSAALRASSSWRITKPLRSLKRLFL
ncbi:FkbM family methyltransferase [Burkholderia multivorans]|uniref:FkbM family methyltransferase n=1 Tax=Burkholderia multivorans TaxID=87883 RepID=UPI00158D950B|nr:FkbM family methyltransferase [Burkholderia multivorans]MBU9534422.1 FkbM family methyltransferase [Burkholderia multivorans]MDR8787705.1 2-O-methyltransferase NoeI [Burkholderia multivorans]MDR8827467.1 2-O-methyltransferase NoeI [Burkholderia multivorans]